MLGHDDYDRYIKGIIIAESPKAYLVETDEVRYWWPKSKIFEVRRGGKFIDFNVPAWLWYGRREAE